MKPLQLVRYLLLALAVALVGGWDRPARAATGTSLDSVPAEAHLYVSMLRCREQVEAIAKSNWWAKLTSMPVVQMGWQEFMNTWNGPGGPGTFLNAFLEDPENAALLELAAEMGSDEVFVYGNKKVADLMDIYIQVGNSSNVASLGMMIMLARGEFDFEKVNRMRVEALIEPIVRNVDRIAVPEVVIGFKIKDKARAMKQVDRLAALIKENPDAGPLGEAVKKATVAGSSFWVMEIAGEMIPWDEIPLAELGDDAEKMQKVVEHCKKLKAAIAIGVHQGYLLISIGPSTAHLANFGKGTLLADHADFAPLKKHFSKQLTGLSYFSRDLVASAGPGVDDVKQFADSAKRLLAISGLEDSAQEKIAADVEELLKDFASILPEPAAAASVSYRTDKGFESYGIYHGLERTMDGSKPLTILNHVGGSPLLVFAGRAAYAPGQYETFVKWLKKGHGYFELFALPQMQDEEREMYQQVMEKVKPLLARLDKANSTLLIPALADGQSALVIDAKLASKQWVDKIPPSEKEIKLLQPALVYGVSDAEKLKKACAEYRAVVNEAIGIAREIAPGQIPEGIEWPEPSSRSLGAGTVYWYPLPKEWGADKRLAPNAGLSKSIAALSIAPQHTQALLESTPPKFPGPLANPARPLARAFHLDFAGLVDATKDWVEMGIKTVMVLREAAGTPGAKPIANLQDPVPMDDEMKLIFDTVRDTAELLKAFRGCTSATYIEGKTTVTHTELRVGDIGK